MRGSCPGALRRLPHDRPGGVLAPLAARLRAALADEKQRVNLLVCMGLAGLLLLAVSSWLPADSSTQSAAPAAKTGSTADYAAELETRLQPH